MTTDAEMKDKTETNVIQKPNRSRPQELQSEENDGSTRHPDKEKLTQSKKSFENAETK